MNIVDTQQSPAYCSPSNSSEQQANLLQEQFIASMNHEFRTPLTVVLSCLELLRDQQQRLDTDTQSDFINYAIDACEQLQYLINSILALQEVVKNPKQNARLLNNVQADGATKHVPNA